MQIIINFLDEVKTVRDSSTDNWKICTRKKVRNYSSERTEPSFSMDVWPCTNLDFHASFLLFILAIISFCSW